MTTFEHSRDLDAINALLTNPRAYCRMVNDDCPPIENFTIDSMETLNRFLPVIARNDDGVSVALFLLAPKAPGVAEVHFCFDPATWGKTEAIALEFISWVWETTSIYRLIGPVPSYNRLALQLAHSVGFKDFDIEVGAMKHGLPFNRTLTELRRPNAKVAIA